MHFPQIQRRIATCSGELGAEEASVGVAWRRASPLFGSIPTKAGRGALLIARLDPLREIGSS